MVNGFVRNCWYVAAWSHEVQADAPFARTITGTPVLFWRDREGRVCALEDRCCHRGAPLSKGRREGDCIRCMYHGMLFDRTGQCVEIPSQKAIPAAARVRAYPIVEKDTWIWIWMGDATLADPARIPATPQLSDPLWPGLPGYLHYDADYLLIADNLLDFSHLAFVHETTLGGSASYAAVQPTVELRERSIRVERWLLDDEPAPFLKGLKSWPGRVDRWNIYEFVLPGILLMDSGSAPTGTGAPAGTRVDAAQFFSCQAITPETAGTTHYFFKQMHAFARDDASVTRRLADAVLAGFEEDRQMILAQQANLAAGPDRPMLALRMDKALFAFRKMIDSALRAERAAAAD